jgi:hypothetical protein
MAVRRRIAYAADSSLAYCWPRHFSWVESKCKKFGQACSTTLADQQWMLRRRLLGKASYGRSPVNAGNGPSSSITTDLPACVSR